MEVVQIVDPFVFRVTLFVLALFVGYYVVWSVTPALHTPLMSGSNAISGIANIGALIATGARDTSLATMLGTLAVALATVNVVGGFLVTNRMLGMFKSKSERQQ